VDAIQTGGAAKYASATKLISAATTFALAVGVAIETSLAALVYSERI